MALWPKNDGTGKISFANKLYLKDFETFYPDNFKRPLHYIKKGLTHAKNKELIAKLLFAAAQSEQGLFYQKGVQEFTNKNDDPKYSKEYKNNFMTFKVKNYRTYFKTLNSNYSDTDYYQTLRTECLSFDYYVTHF